MKIGRLTKIANRRFIVVNFRVNKLDYNFNVYFQAIANQKKKKVRDLTRYHWFDSI